MSSEDPSDDLKSETRHVTAKSLELGSSSSTDVRRHFYLDIRILINVLILFFIIGTLVVIALAASHDTPSTRPASTGTTASELMGDTNTTAPTSAPKPPTFAPSAHPTAPPTTPTSAPTTSAPSAPPTLSPSASPTTYVAPN